MIHNTTQYKIFLTNKLEKDALFIQLNYLMMLRTWSKMIIQDELL